MPTRSLRGRKQTDTFKAGDRVRIETVAGGTAIAIFQCYAAALRLASIARHADELIDSLVSRDEGGVEFDMVAIRALLSDNEVMAYMIACDRQALLPVKRR